MTLLKTSPDSEPTDVASAAKPPPQEGSVRGTRAHFFERKAIVQELVRGIRESRPLDFALIGAKYMGKSKVLRRLAAPDGPLREKAAGSYWKVVPLYYDCKQLEPQGAAQGREEKGRFMQSLVDFVIQELKALEAEENPETGLYGVHLDWDPIEENPVGTKPSPVSTLHKIVRQLARKQVRLALLLDNFDIVLKKDAVDLSELNELRPLTRELALVVSSEQPLPDVNPKLMASPLFNVMHQIFLGLISKEEALPWLKKQIGELPGQQDSEFAEELWRWTGGHPFLLDRVKDALQDAMARSPSGELYLPLIELRLTEHSRFVFETLAQKINEAANNPEKPVPALEEVIRRLVNAREGTTNFDLPRHGPALNWLINQTLVIYDAKGYQLFSPLFKEYLRTHGFFALAEEAAAEDVESVERFLDRLTPKEGALLRYFLDRPDQVISTEQLLAEIWRQPDASSTRRVQEGIRRLRRRLSQASPPIGRIENERGRGYRFVPATIGKGNGYDR